MDLHRKTINDTSTVLKLPEMSIFWFSVPFLVLIILADVFYLPFALALLSGAFVVVVGGVIFTSAFRVGRLNRNNALERSELRNIVFGLTDALVAYDQKFRILFFNPAAEKLFGIAQTDIIDKQLSPQDAQDPRLQRLAQVMFPSLAPVMIPRSNPGAISQIVDLSFSDPLLELQVVTSPIGDEKGIVGFMKVIRDRTREISVFKSKNEFITIASHQLRTPLTELNWALEALSQSTGLDEAGKDIAQNALRAAQQLTRINEDLLDAAKIEEGHFGYTFENTSLVSFLENELSRLFPLIQQAGLQLYFDKPVGLPSVMIDRQKMSMVLNNVLENAIRYNTKNGEIVVKVEQVSDKPYLRVSVKDSGIGIPAEDLKKVFTKFFRAPNAVKFKTEGSGLGLYIARNIIRAHGGQIELESELNRGTTVLFTIPTDKALVPQREIPLEY